MHVYTFTHRNSVTHTIDNVCDHTQHATHTHTYSHVHTLTHMLARYAGSHTHTHTHSHARMTYRLTHTYTHSLTCSHDIQAHTHIHTLTDMLAWHTGSHTYTCTLHCCTHTHTRVQLNTLLLALIVPVEVLWYSLRTCSLSLYITLLEQARLTFCSTRKDQCAGACLLKNAPGGESLAFLHMIHRWEGSVTA